MTTIRPYSLTRWESIHQNFGYDLFRRWHYCILPLKIASFVLDIEDTFWTIDSMKCVCVCACVCMRATIDTSRTPLWATNLPAAVVAPPARKLECWNWPLFFFPMYKFLVVLRTNIHLVPSSVSTKIPLCLYTSFSLSTITSYASLSFCQEEKSYKKWA